MSRLREGHNLPLGVGIGIDIRQNRLSDAGVPLQAGFNGPDISTGGISYLKKRRDVYAGYGDHLSKQRFSVARPLLF